MKAKDIMSTPVLSVEPDTTVREVAALLLDHRISAVPVVEGGKLGGIVSEGDLIRRAEMATAERHRSWWPRLLTDDRRLAADYVKSHASRVRDIMIRPVITVGDDDSLATIVDRMEESRVKRLPVLSDGRVVGIVSRADLVRALATRQSPSLGTDVPDDSLIRKKIVRVLESQPWASTRWLSVNVDGGFVEFRGAYRAAIERDAARCRRDDPRRSRGRGPSRADEPARRLRVKRLASTGLDEEVAGPSAQFVGRSTGMICPRKAEVKQTCGPPTDN